jgi:hypothetical protein
VSVEEVLEGADRQARPLAAAEPPLAALELPLLAGFAWDAEDAADHRWYPQGITSSHDAMPDGLWRGREVILVSWALDNHAAVRISFAELEPGGVRRYRHVLLGEPVRLPWERRVRLRPVRVHAGGIAWSGPYLWVADTIRGLRAFAVDQMLELANGDLVMPQVGAQRLRLLPALVARGPRFSFVSLDRPADAGPPTLLAGEYRDQRPGSRIVRWPLPEPGAGEPRPLTAIEAFTTPRSNLQAVLGIDRGLLLASSAGRDPGELAVYRDPACEPATVHRWAVGPEDLTHLRGRDLVMSLTERPHDTGDCAACGRVVFAVSAGALLDRGARA